MEKSEHKRAGQNLTFELSPGKTFALGIVGGIMTLCTIGFFILLAVYFNGGMTSGSKVAANPSPTVTNPTPSAAPDELAPSNIQLAAVDEKRDHIKGSNKAKVTIVEYSDFECPFCQRFHQQTLAPLMDAYGDQIRLVYRHFPLSFHPQAVPAALASECAAEQGKFWEMHDMLFNSGVVQTGSYSDYAKTLGLNVSKFDTCMKDQKYMARIQEDQQSGASAGVQGTPFSVIIGPDGQKVPVSGAFPYASVEAEVKAMLQ